MKALIYADWCVVRQVVLRYLLTSVAMVVMICAPTLVSAADVAPDTIAAEVTGTCVAACGCMFAMYQLFTVFGADEQNDWELSRLTFPVTRRQVVFARYAYLGASAVVSAFLGLAVGVVMSVAAQLYGGHGIDLGGVAESLLLVAVIVAVVLAAFSLQLPVLFKQGMAKARMAITLPFFLPFVLTIAPLREQTMTLARNAEGFLDAVGPFIAGGVLLLIALALFAASASFSAKIYESREF